MKIENTIGIRRITRGSGLFKLVCALGPSRTPGKVRVMVYSSNSNCYSNVQVVKESQLEVVDKSTLTSRQRAVWNAAYKAAYEHEVKK